MNKKVKNYVVPVVIAVIAAIVCIFVSILIDNNIDTPKDDGIYINGVKIVNDELTVREFEKIYGISKSNHKDELIAPRECINVTFGKLLNCYNIWVYVENCNSDIESVDDTVVNNITATDYSFFKKLLKIYKNGKYISINSSKNDVLEMFGVPIITTISSYQYYYCGFKIDIEFNSSGKVDRIRIEL